MPFPLQFNPLFPSSVFIAIIVSGYLYHHLPWVPRRTMATRISDKIYRYCTEPYSLSSSLTKDPTKSAAHYAQQLYGGERMAIMEHQPPHLRKPASQEDLERARQCGNWGSSTPSDLFLRCFHDALCSLEHDPLVGMVSPSLMGTTGTIPLTILAPLPDICKHMSNLIVRAKKEVFLATNFWVSSTASRLITDALLELSARAGSRNQKMIVKIMYDRGNVKQAIDNHQIVPVSEYTGSAVKLPSPEQIPNIDMQVQNFHRPMLGTFHSKFMIVDREIAIVQSNNIQDNDNLEMMTHLEGAVVDSLYDTAILSWEKVMEPLLPCLGTPAMESKYSTCEDLAFRALFEDRNGMKENTDGRKRDSGISEGESLPPHAAGDPHYDADIASEMKRVHQTLIPKPGETNRDAVTRHLNLATKLSQPGTAPDFPLPSSMTPYVPHTPHSPFPIALVNRHPFGAPNNTSLSVPQNAAWLSAIANATSTIFIQTPDLNAAPLIPALLSAVKRGVEVTYYVCLGYNDSGELLPGQGGTNEMVANTLYTSLENAGDGDGDGEGNEEVRKRLHVHYYVAKDQVMPIHNKFKKRSCHVKLMIVDGHLGIQGNGNQDTQSWCHSMEVNVMIDSKEICGEWQEALKRNQNTHIYGAASQTDGIWRDAGGKEADGAIGKDPGRFSWAKGVVGAVQRVRGVHHSLN
ncbi:IQ calmodulin-binding motif protein [Clohesyomyces aquaticus]|uniref:IQ calmodulin-binding motif protein n=1 Tax=Clohesyomyces aquaticus TaxID=1231657 RepID=A0A1Y1ZRC8_9PLEO|nr:IQ calmodulin-binding motif protein [Clohesyomyces aquaticus]